MVEAIWSNNIDDILCVGVSLEAIDVRNWAIPQSIALETLHSLEATGVAILGGDVLELIGDEFCHRYDNWYSETLDDEPIQFFATRSIEIARQYIINYKSAVGLNVYFSFVPYIGNE